MAETSTSRHSANIREKIVCYSLWRLKSKVSFQNFWRRYHQNDRHGQSSQQSWTDGNIESGNRLPKKMFCRKRSNRSRNLYSKLTFSSMQTNEGSMICYGNNKKPFCSFCSAVSGKSSFLQRLDTPHCNWRRKLNALYFQIKRDTLCVRTISEAANIVKKLQNGTASAVRLNSTTSCVSSLTSSSSDWTKLTNTARTLPFLSTRNDPRKNYVP